MHIDYVLHNLMYKFFVFISIIFLTQKIFYSYLLILKKIVTYIFAWNRMIMTLNSIFYCIFTDINIIQELVGLWVTPS